MDTRRAARCRRCRTRDLPLTAGTSLFQLYVALASRLGAAGVAPTTTMLGVTRLAIPGQLVELEATAVG